MTEKIGPKDGAVKARQSPRSREAGNADGQKSTSSAKTASKGRGKQNKRAPKIPYEPDQIAEIFRRFAVQRPEPESELEHSNPFTLLVAVVLSAQATDAGVNKATRGLFASADTPEAMAALGEDAIRDHIKTMERAALEALPGVGRKTANVVLNVAFGEETLAVDTHIFRIGNRLKLAPGKTPDEVEARLLPIVPQPYRRHAHHWLILHGRYVCKARTPECWRCPVADLCSYRKKTPEPQRKAPVRKA